MKLHLIIDTQVDEKILHAQTAAEHDDHYGVLLSANYVTAIFAGFLPKQESHGCRQQTRSYERIGTNRDITPGKILNAAL